tara:strand:- start:178218 stop:179093 length:876 start_codon:yes stop_codon:yes gene_type:complete
MFKGSMAALVTPMQDDGKVDFDALEELVFFHIKNQTDALVLLGTTAESPTLTKIEKQQIVTNTLNQVAGKMPIMVGVGTNATTTTVDNVKQMTSLGVDGLLIISPYYNKPTQEGLYQHFMMAADATHLPVILYNHVGRTGVDIQPTTAARLAKASNITGLKETVSVERAQEVLQLTNKLDIFCGDDPVNLQMLQAGAKGIISVTANVTPKALHDMCAAYANGDHSTAEAIHKQLSPLHKELGLETNPIPVKWALNYLDLIPPGIRLPLTPLSEEYHQNIINALQMAGVLGE